jgi:hypothetical protein
MNAPLATPINGDALPDAIDSRSPAEIFAGHCEARAMRVVEGILSIREATDELQGYAKLSGLIDQLGQDGVQEIMSEAFAMAEAAPDELNEAYEREIMVLAADLVRQWEMADSRDRWRHTGEARPPRTIERPPAKPYRTPQSTIDAFWYVVRLDDPDYLARWLADHPRDAAFLLKIWKARPC